MLDKLKEGRYLDLPTFNDIPPNATPGMHQHMLLVTNRIYNIAESTGKHNPFKHTSSSVTTGAHVTKAHRTFRWLPWVAGKITVTPIMGPDILTGPFTGCWATIFTLNGTQYVGHIGTNLTADNPLTIQVKAAWDEIKQLPGFVLHAAFSPLRQTPQPWITKVQRAGQTISILAAIAPNRSCKVFGVSPDLTAGVGQREILGSINAPDLKANMPF